PSSSIYPARIAMFNISLHDALPIYGNSLVDDIPDWNKVVRGPVHTHNGHDPTLFYRVDCPVKCGCRTSLEEQVFSGYGLHCVSRSEEHTPELKSRENLVCRLLLEKK